VKEIARIAKIAKSVNCKNTETAGMQNCGRNYRTAEGQNYCTVRDVQQIAMFNKFCMFACFQKLGTSGFSISAIFGNLGNSGNFP